MLVERKETWFLRLSVRKSVLKFQEKELLQKIFKELVFICVRVGYRNMFCVWRAYLEGTVQVTQSRISTCDNYKVQINDPVKTARLQKDQQLRKVMQADLTCLLRSLVPFFLISHNLIYSSTDIIQSMHLLFFQ